MLLGFFVHAENTETVPFLEKVLKLDVLVFWPSLNKRKKMLKELHWLPVTYRIQLKIFVTTNKALYGMTPAFLEDLVRSCTNTRYGLRFTSSLY